MQPSRGCASFSIAQVQTMARWRQLERLACLRLGPGAIAGRRGRDRRAGGPTPCAAGQFLSGPGKTVRKTGGCSRMSFSPARWPAPGSAFCKGLSRGRRHRQGERRVMLGRRHRPDRIADCRWVSSVGPTPMRGTPAEQMMMARCSARTCRASRQAASERLRRFDEYARRPGTVRDVVRSDDVRRTASGVASRGPQCATEWHPDAIADVQGESAPTRIWGRRKRRDRLTVNSSKHPVGCTERLVI